MENLARGDIGRRKNTHTATHKMKLESGWIF